MSNQPEPKSEGYVDTVGAYCDDDDEKPRAKLPKQERYGERQVKQPRVKWVTLSLLAACEFPSFSMSKLP